VKLADTVGDRDAVEDGSADWAVAGADPLVVELA
jgi:hypothetical protein